MEKIIAFVRNCIKSESNLFVLFIRGLVYKLLYDKYLLVHHNVVIKGISNIETNDRVEIGLGYFGFIYKNDITYLNVQGKLKIQGKYAIGRGCRFDIGKNAVVRIGNGGYVNCNTNFIIMHNLTIGDYCAISWNCQFLDDDFHQIEYSGKGVSDNAIVIGNHVWIGCGVKIYKGAYIPDNCVVASDSVVKSVFKGENLLIGGNPAKVLRENITWK